ncbi:MAG: arylsulfatase [Bryobacterales bacterium]|nr:arylsulfatase [Bryobacterales bacterium]
MKRRSFLSASFAAVPLASRLAAPLPAQTSRARPNIVFIMADDLGIGDLGCYGQKKIATPNIDRLAREGTLFTQAYSGATVCAPSRGSLMTGKHLGHATIRGNREPEVPIQPGEVTIAEVCKMAGYKTGMFGKWGIGGPVNLGRPNAQGFDEWFGYPTQLHAHMYYPTHLWHNETPVFFPKNFNGANGEYAPGIIFPKALDFIDRHKAESFFLYLPFTYPHTNNELGKQKGDGMEVPDHGSYKDKPWPAPEKGFAAMVERLDIAVGQVLSKLAEHHLERDTLVIFTSDNGAHQEGGHTVDFFDSNGIYRGWKRDLYEGGIHVPFLARWPGHVPAGRKSEQVFAFWDMLPTIAELTGAPIPEGIDGISMANAFLGRPQQDHEYLYWEFHERGFDQAVRLGTWKGVRRSASHGAIELYDLAADPAETSDSAALHPDVVRRIAAIMSSARTESAEFPVRKQAPQ